MAKQIYIDSNGNEVLVSGTITNDNNLPHYTGTPTPNSTAEAIGAVASDVSDLETVTDISSSFTKGQSVTGTFYCKAFYNKGTKRVSVTIAVDVTSGSVSTGQAFAYVASAYRPSSNIYGIPMLVKSSSGWQAYNGVLTSGGDLNQNATNTSTGLYASFEYYL